MSAKKKKVKQAWIKNESGVYILPMADLGRGDGTPKKGLNTSRMSESSPVIKLNHQPTSQPCIYKNVLLCQVAIRPSDKDVVLMEGTINNTIVLHTETMKNMGLILDNCVAIYLHSPSSGWTAVSTYRVWPNNSVPLGKIGMSKQQMTDCDVTACSYCAVRKAETTAAARVTLLPVDPDADAELLWKQLRQFLPHHMRKRPLVRGQRINVVFYGKELSFDIDTIQPRQRDDDTSSTTSSLAELLHSAMDLSDDDGVPEHFRPMTRSPEAPVAYVSNPKTEYEIRGGGGDATSDVTSDDDDDDVVVTLDDVGGMGDVIDKLRRLVTKPMNDPRLYHQLGIRMNNAVMLHGPPGTGKSLLARAIAHETRGKVVEFGYNLSRISMENDKEIRKSFDDLKEVKKNCILLIDDIDQLCPNTKDAKKVGTVSTIMSCLDDLNNLFNKQKSKNKIFVIATTSKLDCVHEKLLNSRRFDEVEIVVPTQDQRYQILHKLLRKVCHNLSDADVLQIAHKCHGFVGRDLELLRREASYNCIQHHQSGSKQIELKLEDFLIGLKHVNPSAIRELVVRVPNVSWSDIGGYRNLKKILYQVIELPLKRSRDFVRLGVAPPRGVLLYGPPGCSKTLTAKALATESGLNFVSIKGPELYSKYVGDSEKSLRNIFKKARYAAPSIIFFDEIDAIACERGSSNGGNAVSDRVLTTLLAEMDGVEQRDDVIVVAATNRPQILDRALIRSGRIDRIIHVPLPDEESRAAIMKLRFSKMLINGDVAVDELVEKSQYFSGAEICRLCDEAGIFAIEEEADDVTMTHFNRALERVKPQSSLQDVEMYEKFARTNAFQ